MKKAGVRFTNDLMVSFDYNEDTKEMNVLVVDGADRYTGSVTVEAPAASAAPTRAAAKTSAKTTTK